MTDDISVSAAILAGGLGRRMGFNKALLANQGEPLLVKNLLCLSPIFDEILIAGHDSAFWADLQTSSVWQPWLPKARIQRPDASWDIHFPWLSKPVRYV